jgi:hypothetical protein
MAKSSRGGSGKGATARHRNCENRKEEHVGNALAGGIVAMICKAEQVLFFLTPSD